MSDDRSTVGDESGIPEAAGQVRRLPLPLRPPPRPQPMRVARVLLPILVAAAFIQASDVIGMVRPLPVPPRPEFARLNRRGFGGGRMALGTPQPGRRLSPSDVPSFAGQ